MGMDTFALGLINAAKIIEDGRLDAFVKERYSSFENGIGKKIRENAVTLEDLFSYAEEMGAPIMPDSGSQEELQNIVNQILFGVK